MQWFGLALACALSRTANGKPLAVHTRGELPFSTAELDAALVLRTQLADASSPVPVDAQVTGERDDVIVAVTGRTRRVALGGQHGADAARLVAFALLDLAGDQLDPPAAPERTQEPERTDDLALVPPPPHATTTTRFEPRMIERAAAPAWSLGLVAAGGTRNELALELGVRLAGPIRIVGSGGAGLSITNTVMTTTITRRALPLRLSLAWRRGAFEARAGAVALIEQASADRAQTDVIVGGGGAVVWSPVRFERFAGFVGAGLDGFATAIDYRVAGQPIATTERIGWWGGVGVAWEAR